MSFERLAYDDQDTANQMHDDCLVCASHMRLPHDVVSPPVLDLTAPGEETTPSRQRARLEISDATADLGARLHLHLD